MIIRKVKEEDLQDLIAYNIKTYSERDKIDESFNYRFYNNPYCANTTNESLIVFDPDNNIIGQALMTDREWKARIELSMFDVRIRESAFQGVVGYLPAGQSAVGNSRVAHRDVSSVS